MGRSYLDNILWPGGDSHLCRGCTSGAELELDLVPDEIRGAKSKLIINAAQVGNMQQGGLVSESRNRSGSKKRKNLSKINGSSIFSTDLNVYKQSGNKFIFTPQKSPACHNQVRAIYLRSNLCLNLIQRFMKNGERGFVILKCNATLYLGLVA